MNQRIDARQALEQLLNVKLPGDFEVKIELHSKDHTAGPALGSIKSRDGALWTDLDAFSNLRFKSVACW